MKRLSGNAWSDAAGTHVQLTGLLADKRTHAAIVDIYPLGRIAYECQPDCAEVFIDLWRDGRPDKVRSVNNSQDLQLAIRWSESVVIETQDFDRLKIYINGNEELEIEIGISSNSGGDVVPWPLMPLRTNLGAFSNSH